MITFLKQQSYFIFRCVAIQIGMTMFGLMMSMATISNDVLMLTVGVFSVLFYLYLLTDAAWSCGNKEQIKIEAGRAPRRPLTGLYASLIANLLNIGLAIAIWVGYFVAASKGTSVGWAQSCKMVATFIQGMYCGIIGFVNTHISDSSLVSTLMYTLIVLPAPVICCVAYYLGTKGVHIVPGYGKKEEI